MYFTDGVFGTERAYEIDAKKLGKKKTVDMVVSLFKSTVKTASASDAEQYAAGANEVIRTLAPYRVDPVRVRQVYSSLAEQVLKRPPCER